MEGGLSLTRSRVWPAAFVAGLLSLGCARRQSADEAVDAALKARGETRESVYPLGGKVTIDGQPAQSRRTENPMLVILNDKSKPDAPLRDRRRVEVGPEGAFAFSTYQSGDGVPAGTYVVTIVQFTFNKKRGLMGPDQLKNLYSDPEKNALVNDFVINHQPPGKRDYVFNLEIEGKEAGTPGPHTLTELPHRK
jgi:hypothetical protein